MLVCLSRGNRAKYPATMKKTVSRTPRIIITKSRLERVVLGSGDLSSTRSLPFEAVILSESGVLHNASPLQKDSCPSRRSKFDSLVGAASQTTGSRAAGSSLIRRRTLRGR